MDAAGHVSARLGITLVKTDQEEMNRDRYDPPLACGHD
jgi:hypothetical protein